MHSFVKTAAMVGSMAFLAWSANAGRYPTRQIDRPLILPRKMWQENLVQNSVFHLADESAYYPYDQPVGFLPTLPAYSQTDNLMWAALPAPLFRYLVTHNNITAENGPAVKDFSLTLDGGVTGFAYSARATAFFTTWGFSAKKPMLNWLWWEGNFQSTLDYLELSGLGGTVGLGFQLTHRMHMVSHYSLNFFPEMENRNDGDAEGVYHSLSLLAAVNFNSNISLGCQSALVAGSESLVWNPGAFLEFHW